MGHALEGKLEEKYYPEGICIAVRISKPGIQLNYAINDAINYTNYVPMRNGKDVLKIDTKCGSVSVGQTASLGGRNG